jgi:hypothetical protein
LRKDIDNRLALAAMERDYRLDGIRKRKEAKLRALKDKAKVESWSEEELDQFLKDNGLL